MFRLLDPGLLSSSIDAYLERPEWVHGPYVVPLLAWLSRRESSWPDPSLPDEVFEHLVWALRGWSAFRGGGSLEDKVRKLRAHLPRFVNDARTCVQATGAHRLSDVPQAALGQFADGLHMVLNQAASNIKQNDSFVLPSKTAHLLFPAMVPAYDVEVVRNRVLNRTLPPRLKGRLGYEIWIKACWWVLTQLRQSGQLERECQKVRDSMLNSWSISILRAQDPRRDDCCAALLDSFVAEYALIGLERRGGRLTPIA